MSLHLINARLHNKGNELFHVILEDNIIKSVKTMSSLPKNQDIIDLNGELLLPGFNDSHLHMMGLGTTLMQCSLTECRSIEDIISTSTDYLNEHSLEENEPFIARGWNEDNFTLSEKPTRLDLDRITTSHPIVFRRACGHMLVCNTKALELLDEDIDKVDGGHFDLTTGHFEENAMDLVLSKLPLPSKERIKEYIIAAQKYLLKLGITSVGSDDLCVFPPTINDLVFDAFEELDRDNKLLVRVYEQSLFRDINYLEKAIENGYKLTRGYNKFIQGPLKILLDGSLGARTAYLNKPYNDQPDTKGIIMYDQDVLNQYIGYAHQHNIDVAIHCIGDGALDVALTAFEKAINQHDFDHRHSIVHCQITRKDQHEKLKSMNIGALAQPIFIDYDHRIVADRVGSELAATSYAFKTLKDMNLIVAYGSDAPVEEPNPLKGIYCAVTRKGLKGSTVFNENEAVSFSEAIEAFSQSGAYYMHLEDKLGSIEVGQIADLCCIKNIDTLDPGTYLSARNVLTICSGKIVYKE